MRDCDWGALTGVLPNGIDCAQLVDGAHIAASLTDGKYSPAKLS